MGSTAGLGVRGAEGLDSLSGGGLSEADGVAGDDGEAFLRGCDGERRCIAFDELLGRG